MFSVESCVCVCLCVVVFMEFYFINILLLTRLPGYFSLAHKTSLLELWIRGIGEATSGRQQHQTSYNNWQRLTMFKLKLFHCHCKCSHVHLQLSIHIFESPKSQQKKEQQQQTKLSLVWCDYFSFSMANGLYIILWKRVCVVFSVAAYISSLNFMRSQCPLEYQM